MRRIAGVDINGWKDMAARDWSPGEEDAEKGKVFLVDGGVGSVAVRQASGIWVGGPRRPFLIMGEAAAGARWDHAIAGSISLPSSMTS